MLDRTSAPAISGFPLLSLPDFEENILPNGIRLFALDSGEEAVSRLSILWKTGLLDVDSQAAYGLMANLLSEGCDGLSGNDVSDILESNGAWFKVSPSHHSTLLTLHSLNHTANVVYPLVGKLITSPTFPTDALESIKQKNAAEREIALRKPSYQATLLARTGLYGDKHPLAKSVTPADILGVEHSDVTSLHRDTLLANKPVVFLSGKITPELKSLAEEMLCAIPFDDLRDSKVSRRIIEPRNLTSCATLRKEMPDSLQTGVRVQIPTIPREHPDYESLRFATVALGGYFGSRLMANIREDKGYTYGIGANLVPSLEGCNIIISCECDNRYTDDVVREIQLEIQRIASDRLPDEELETVRNILISNLAGILDSPFSISSFREQGASLNLPKETFSNQFAEAMSMTADRVMATAAKYLLNAPSITALAGGKPG